MKIGVPKETLPGELRVALVPDSVAALSKAGHEALVQSGAGVAAGFPDTAYRDKGAVIVPERREIFRSADVVFQVRGLGANLEAGRADLELMQPDQVLVGMFDPLSAPQAVKDLADHGVTAFALELTPRITRAQGMDVLSSQATVAGYKAVLIAANTSPRMFPMFMTAAGTISPAHVLIIGAGVAGLQAISTARRLGAVVRAYDVRPAVKEQVESLGAKFVELELETADAEDRGGYAKEMSDELLRKQRELMAKVVSESHVLVTTAVVPGKKAPLIVTADMVKGMMPGSVIIDLAAERGGNCELTRPGETVVEHGVTVMGPLNLPATAPLHASQMYARNLVTFLKELTDGEGKLVVDLENEVIHDTLLTRAGEIINERVRELLRLEPAAGKGAQ
ncbi:MAG: Re/Si-specific NAD(P)(+) transhydrogenase subunit alpha [Phycisphaerae bacterium]